MAPLTDLAEMLRTLTISQRPGTFAFVTTREPLLDTAFEALIHEDEGATYVVAADTARQLGFVVDFEAAWLTLDVNSALEAVGLTAAVSEALTAVGIPCNVLAGFHHDHLLVPSDRAGDAITALTALTSEHSA